MQPMPLVFRIATAALAVAVTVPAFVCLGVALALGLL